MSAKIDYGAQGLSLLSGCGGDMYDEPQTGWTYPATIYDDMRRIHAIANGLDRDITVNVKRDDFIRSWRIWFADWQAFFDKHLGDWSNTQKVLNAFQTDELKAQVYTYSEDLHKFQDGYDRELTTDGKPLPPRTSPNALPPPPPTPKSEDHKGFFGSLEIPWWVWGVGGAVVLGAGYLAYRSLRAQVSVAQTGARLLAQDPSPPFVPVAEGVATEFVISGSDPPSIISQHGALYRKV